MQVTRTGVLRRLKRRLKEHARAYLSLPKSHIETIAEYVFAEAVEGDYLEFGVFRGHSFMAAYHSLEAAGKEWRSEGRNRLAYSDPERAKASHVRLRGAMRYVAFDSFDGLPEPTGIDQGNARFSRGRYDCSQEAFLSNLARHGVDLSRVVVVRGWYHDTLCAATKQQHHLKAAAVVMIDCDLYESATYVLNFITDLLVDGSVLIFDDWFNFKGHPDRGERRAAREWVEKNPHIRLTDYHTAGPTQKSFIVTRDG